MSDEDLGLPTRADIAQSPMMQFGGQAGLDLIDALVLGRQGRRDEATAAARGLEDRLSATGLRRWSAYGPRLGAEAAVRDGWGIPPAGYARARNFSPSVASLRQQLPGAGRRSWPSPPHDHATPPAPLR